ncbi:MAG: FAD-dependent oxidoreductase [bacterium]
MPVRELNADILIVGGGVGGCAAAMAAAAMGRRVVLSEPTDWLGGQLTSQATPPDEHPWIERCGATQRYRHFRAGVRKHYQQNYPLTHRARESAYLNPGQATVSGLCHEPRAALAVIENMLATARSAGRLRTLLGHEPVAADVADDRVEAVMLRDRLTGEEVAVTARFVLDATELGDLLPLTRAEYVCGAESQRQTGEPHAVQGAAQPDNVQAFTWCFAMGYDPSPGAAHVIDRPRDYTFWRSYQPNLAPAWPGPLLSWFATHPITGATRTFQLFGDSAKQDFSSLWHYRRILAAEQFSDDSTWHDVSIVNWPQNDYLEGSLIDREPDEVARAMEGARQLSLSLFHWLQTEAPREDGGTGYPGLYLCPEQMGTHDGLAKAPYIRESRRIQAVRTVREQDVGHAARDGRPAARFDDTVGIGYYRIDLHPTTGGDNYIDIASMPFQIPLGALLPIRLRNLFPACKNIGTTHITNGCYRLHPVEWNVGEAAGLLAACCLAQKTEPHAVHADAEHLAAFQGLLVRQGIELAWPGDCLQPH